MAEVKFIKTGEEFSKIEVAIKDIASQIDSLKLLRTTLTKEIISGQLYIE